MDEEHLDEEEEEEEEIEEAAPEEIEEEHVEEESILTEYDPEEFLSGAITTLDSTIPNNLFEFEHSYGYDCYKYFNLCACDDTVVAWAAGSIIAFMDVITKQTWFRRSTTGGSVGCVSSYRKDPNYRIAIAEGREGDREPLILLYTWPQMDIDAVLRDGTTNAYSILDFSPDGELLASVGKEPDYNLTLWTWKRHRILLRTSAFTYDVNSVMFSPYCPGQLTTAGAAHIKFWKMAQTFTGLKLKGELGRFGKTEICDVLGVYPMPDEKVLSGCEWGNVLVWEAGLVKIEVTQRGRKRCHGGPVIQFMLSPAGDEVTTIARDGCIRAWYWDTVEQADPPEDDQYVELNPVAETCVPDCQIMCLKHQKDSYYYAQDGNGGIWTVELELDKVECDHRKVMTCHAGPVVALAALRGARVLLAAGADGALQAYDAASHALLARYRFPAAVCCLLYPPADVDPTSCTLILGFADGVMRTLFVHPEPLLEQSKCLEVRMDSSLTVHSEDSERADIIELISYLKPHSKKINEITINEQRTLLVTCSEDSTIFMYQLEKGTPFQLQRLGFIETPNNIAFMTWKPGEEKVLLLCGQVGLLMEVVLPDVAIRKYTDITTFKLEFESFKESLIKKQFMRHRPFPTEEDLASLDEEALKANKEQSEKEKDDEDEMGWLGEIELMESESMLGTTLTWAQYCEDGVWVVQRGTGALLLINPGVHKILKYGPFPGAWCDDITALKFVCEGRYLVIGTGTGMIRVVRMPTEEEDNPDRHYTVWMLAQQKLLKELKGRRLAKVEKQPTPRIDFEDNYYLAMHDRYTGAIRCLEFSYDGNHLYTCGDDGNIFSYTINFTEPLLPETELPSAPVVPHVQRIPEPSTVDGEVMSHEQLKQKEEYDKMMAIANAHKKRVRDQLAELTVEYNKLIRENRLLPYSQQLDMTLDPRPLEQQEVELDQARALTVRKLAHQLEASDLALWKMHSTNIIQLDVFPFKLRAIRDPEVIIRPLRQKNLSQAFYDQLEEVYRKMAEAALRGRRAESLSRRMTMRKASWGPPRVASFLLGLPPKPNHPLKKALRNYHQRLNRHHIQFIEWQEHLSRKPDPNALPPGAAEALKEAESTIGNHLLKTQPDYVAPPGHNTQLRLCLTRQEIYENKHHFNEKVMKLREDKLRLVDTMKRIGERLAEIRVEIPQRLAKSPPAIPLIDEDLEFPERNLEVRPEIVHVPVKGAPASAKRDPRKSYYPQPRARQSRVARFITLMESKPLTATWEILKPRQDHVSSPIEIEIRDRRIYRHLYEQDMLLADAEVSVQQFDSRLRQLQRERVRVQEKNQLLELHLYQMHREMNVLNRFEAHEDRLADRVYSKLMQVRSVQDQIQDCEHRIEDHHSEKAQLDVHCQELQRQFKRMVQDNKFADFLRRIFKKKYRAPRIRDDDESSESESESSSSEDEDEGSLDSRDIGPIRLDPTICPDGCDKELYDKTYELRDNRHKFEQEIIEQDRFVDLLKKDIEAHNRVKRKLSLQLDKRKSDLREFMMEKQSCMNEVEQVVVLRYEQVRASALARCREAGGAAQAVVFPEALLARLRARVLELHREIAEQRQRHRINRTHLHRMLIDLRAMEASADELRAEMREVLTRKLGRPRRVDRTLDDLLRQMARRHKFSANLGELPAMLAQLRTWRNKHCDLEKKYLASLEHYSERLRVAAALQFDAMPVKRVKEVPPIPGAYSMSQYERDVVRLLIVRNNQIAQINALQEEIKTLKLKPLSELALPPSISTTVTEVSHIELFRIPRPHFTKHKYFPITPLGSHVQLVYDVNVMKLLYDCMDALRSSREDAPILLKDLQDRLPDVLAGIQSRYEVVDHLVKTWTLRHGGDPSGYKKNTRAFDALAAVADRLIREHVEAIEGKDADHHRVMQALEDALKSMSRDNETLQDKLGPVLASLLHTAPLEVLETEEAMVSIVNSLLDENNPLTKEMIDEISLNEVLKSLSECGVDVPREDLMRLVDTLIHCFRATIISPEEKKIIDMEVEEALNIDEAILASTTLATPDVQTTPLLSDVEENINIFADDVTAEINITDNVEGVETADNAEAVETADNAEPANNAEAVETTDNAEPADNVEAVETTDNAEPADNVEAVETTDNADNAETVDNAEAVETADNAEPADNAEAVDTTEAVDNIENTDNAEHVDKEDEDVE